MNYCVNRKCIHRTRSCIITAWEELTWIIIKKLIKKLIEKLIIIGVQGRELDWYLSYLAERYQSTKVNDHHSNKAPVKFGVPQGSILGPLLFTLYINDLPSNIRSTSSSVYLYADDTATFVKGKSIDVINTTMNTDLAHVSQWLQSNYLTLNVKKKASLILVSGVNIWIMLINLSTLVFGLIHLPHGVSRLTILCPKINQRIGLLRRVRNILPKARSAISNKW